MENPIKTIIHIIDGGKVMPTRSPSGHLIQIVKDLVTYPLVK